MLSDFLQKKSHNKKQKAVGEKHQPPFENFTKNYLFSITACAAASLA